MTSGVERPWRAWLASFAAPGLEEAQQHLVRSARRLPEFVGTTEWTLAGLGALADLRARPRLLDRMRDDRLGLWRPFVLLEQLRAVPDGDLVVYHDAGVGYWGPHAFRATIAPALHWAVACNGGMLPGVWLPEDGRNARWTTRACFRALGCDEDRYWSTPQIQATYSIWRRSGRALDFVARWRDACLAHGDEAAADGPAGPAGDGNFADFVADRGAQSVLTNLALRDAIACFGRPHETTAAITHPSYSPVPPTDIGNLCVRIVRDGALRLTAARAPPAPPPAAPPPAAPPPAAPDRPVPAAAAGSVAAGGRMALFTSIPPRLDRQSAGGLPIGEAYQEECLASWRRCGFEVCSVHGRGELATLRRRDGVTYVAVDEPDGEAKPSLRAMLDVARRSGAAVAGIINADILLLDPPGWRDVVRREIAGSVIVVTRYEMQDIDRTCIGWAPWGFDVVLFDPACVDGLDDCGMRLGESWWDYWLPLACHFAGATLKHVDDCIALHQDHPIVSSGRIDHYGQRFLDWLARAAAREAERGELGRASAFHDYCRHRFPIEAARIGVAVGPSYRFFTEVLNPTVWAGLCAIVRASRLEVVAKDDPHHRLVAEMLLRAAQQAVHQRNLYLTLRAEHARALSGQPLIDHAVALSRSWPYRVDAWLGNAVRRARGRPPRPDPAIATAADALAFLRRLDSRLVWALAGPLRYAAARIGAAVASRAARRARPGGPLPREGAGR
jgi:hypothetical protein